MAPVKINLSALKYEIQPSIYHRNPPASQVEAIANYLGFTTEQGYPNIAQALANIRDEVESKDARIKGYLKLIKEDLTSLATKKAAVPVKSGVPDWVLCKYGLSKGICFLLLERDVRRTAFKVMQAIGETDYFEPALGLFRGEEPPHICPLVVSTHEKEVEPTYEFLNISEGSQANFVELVVAALTPGKKPPAAVRDHLRIGASEVLKACMPVIERAITKSLVDNRQHWVPVK